MTRVMAATPARTNEALYFTLFTQPPASAEPRGLERSAGGQGVVDQMLQCVTVEQKMSEAVSASC
jgi:hypothetical protein